MKALLLIISLFVTVSTFANDNKTETTNTGATVYDYYTPISQRTYYLETSKDSCTYKEFIAQYKSGSVKAVKGYKFENGLILKNFPRVEYLTQEKPQNLKNFKGRKLHRY